MHGSVVRSQWNNEVVQGAARVVGRHDYRWIRPLVIVGRFELAMFAWLNRKSEMKDGKAQRTCDSCMQQTARLVLCMWQSVALVPMYGVTGGNSRIKLQRSSSNETQHALNQCCFGILPTKQMK